jgi:ribosomal protein L37AE/L43A
VKTTNAVDEAIRKAEAEGRVKDSRLDRMAEAVKDDLSAKPCPACDGEGQRDNNGNCWSCSACNGTGLSAPAKPAKLRKPRKARPILPQSWSVTFEVPVAVISEMNRRDHWTARRKRFNLQAEELCYAIQSAPLQIIWYRALPCHVALTHFGSEMDDDNLRSAFKAVRDQLAKMLGVADNDPRIVWEYLQNNCTGTFGFRVEISKA